MIHHVLYTREQADQVLPLVRAIVEDQREVYLRVRANLSAFRTIEELDEISGDHRLPRAMRDDLAEMRGYLLELEELGVKVEDPELGLVTMRGLYRGDVVNLCWKLGEDRVRFWFPRDGDYAARRPLDAVAV
jgi:hypothetical protein